VPLSYECLDADCGHVIVAADQAALVAAVQKHMASEHDSFELEDTITDSAQEVAEGAEDDDA
jgi:predicted small metal-binding protein